MKKILTVVGTRPNFIKITQFQKEFEKKGIEHKLLHTGQHYDTKMSDVFFKQLEINEPDYHLGIKAGSPCEQIGKIIIELEKVLLDYKPDMLLVVGDVNSTMAAAITGNKVGVPIGHIESGLRSFDRTMPEEHNRAMTDAITDHYFITEPSGTKNLLAEGKDEKRMHDVGNTMIDTLVAFEEEIQQSEVLSKYELTKNEFVLMTMHRPANVDTESSLKKIVSLLSSTTEDYKVVWPIHPRTISKATDYGLIDELKNIEGLILTDPLDYFSFQKLIADCKFVLTDSGGIQEETTFRQKPCLTLRENTERPVTITEGTNTLVSFDLDEIGALIKKITDGSYKPGTIPHHWDGRATERIAEVIRQL